jgi:hypothetical protein
MKLHLKKVIGLSILTFEEFRTLLCDIEAIMNSRPLVPVSDDPNDLVALTPNMIVTGKSFRPYPLAANKPMKAADMRIHPHDRWTYVQRLVETFWARWSKEYVTTLQAREKWATEKPELKEGELVLVTDENKAPLKWALGRVEKIFTGNDSVGRAVLVKTEIGSYKRPANKLRRLPLYERENKKDETSYFRTSRETWICNAKWCLDN